MPVVAFSVAYTYLVIWIAERYDVGMEQLSAYFMSHIALTTFLLTFFVGAANSSFKDTIGHCRSFLNITNDVLALAVNFHCSSAEPKPENIHAVRRYLSAVAWAAYGFLDEDLRDEAHEQVRQQVDETDLSRLSDVGSGGKLVGQTCAYGLLQLAHRRMLAMGQPDPSYDVFRLGAQLRRLTDVRPDQGKLHLAYVHLLTFNTSCLLMLAPWGLQSEMGWWNLVGTPTLYCSFLGLLVIGWGLLFPFQGAIRINAKQLLQEHESTAFAMFHVAGISGVESEEKAQAVGISQVDSHGKTKR